MPDDKRNPMSEHKKEPRIVPLEDTPETRRRILGKKPRKGLHVPLFEIRFDDADDEDNEPLPLP